MWLYGGGMCTCGQMLWTSRRGCCIPWSWFVRHLVCVCVNQTWMFYKSNTCSHPCHSLISSDTDWLVDWLMIDYLVCVEVSSRLSLLSHLTDLIYLYLEGVETRSLTPAGHEFLWSSCLYLPGAEVTGMHHQEFALFSLSTGQLNWRVMDGKEQF